MPIIFENNVLLVNDTQIRLYTNISNRTLASGVTPYIRHTNTPRFSWNAIGVNNSGPLTFRVQITWLGTGSIVPEEEIDVNGILTGSFSVGVFQRLRHVFAADAGGAYELIVTASQQNQADVKIGGQFMVNYKPTPPINLHVN